MHQALACHGKRVVAKFLPKGRALNDHSVTVWLNQLKQGDQSAAKKLWDRYGQTLVRLARQRYRTSAGPAFDEEDLIQCVFTELWTAATTGRLAELHGRDQLWWLLLAITRRKAMSRLEYETRQKRDRGIASKQQSITTSENSSISPSPFSDPNQPPPDLILVLEEEQERLLDLLRDDTLRSIALWKLDGYSHDEIANRLTVTTRTVERKIHLIRKRWAKELDL